MFRILIVDDTKSVHAFVKSLLAKSPGLNVTSVYNGLEAQEILKKEKFDLIFLDWEMPVMDGPTALAELKAKGLKTPIIMMTTKNAPDDIQRMLSLGVAEYLLKPFTIDILFEKISYVTGKTFEYASP